MKRFLITGANRGLGLEMTRQLLARGDEVLATCRDRSAAAELQALKPQAILELEVADPSSIAALARRIEAEGWRFDVLVNNAGIGDQNEVWGKITAARMVQVLTTNSVAPVLLTQALEPFVGAKVVCITSGLGSITRAFESGYGISYPMSKAALNMAVKQLSLRLGPSKAIVALCPGWTQTDMGGPSAHLTPRESVQAQLQVIDGLQPSDTGRYFNYTGEELPW